MTIDNVISICYVSAALLALLGYVSGGDNRWPDVLERLLIGSIFLIFGNSLISALFLILQLSPVCLYFVATPPLLYVAYSFRAQSLFLLRMLVSRASTFLLTVLLFAPVFLNYFVATFKSEWSIDGRLYHGPVLANMVEKGSLWGWDVTNQYAYYTNLTMAGGVLSAKLTPAVIFDDAIQVPYLGLILICIYFIFRQFNASHGVATLLSLSIVSTPVIWMQSRVLYVDLAYSSTFLALAGIILLLLKRGANPLNLLALGTVLAAMAATKPAGILPATFFLISAIGVLIFQSRGSSETRMLANVFSLLIPVPLGLLFYVRNFIQFLNPFYPVATSIFGFKLNGPIDFSTFSEANSQSSLANPARLFDFLRGLLSGSLNGITKLDYDPRIGGFSIIPISVFVLVLFIWIFSRRTTGEVSSQMRVKFLAFLSAIVAVTITFQPRTDDARYVIGPGVLITIMALIPLMSKVGTRRILLSGLAILSLISISFNEVKIFPGIAQVIFASRLDDRYKSSTPGEALGAGIDFSWLPDDRCYKIAIQSQGGVGPTGMMEITKSTTLSYGLYGKTLCNSVIVFQLPNQFDANTLSEKQLNNIGSADFIVLDTNDDHHLPSDLNEKLSNFIKVTTVRADNEYPEGGQTIYRSSFR